MIGLACRGARVTVVTAGLAVLATAQPMTADDRFRVGSITKSFVATLVLKLAVGAFALWLAPLSGRVPARRRVSLAVADRRAQDLATGFYCRVTGDGVTAAQLDQEARALHQATRELRARFRPSPAQVGRV